MANQPYSIDPPQITPSGAACIATTGDPQEIASWCQISPGRSLGLDSAGRVRAIFLALVPDQRKGADHV